VSETTIQLRLAARGVLQSLGYVNVAEILLPKTPTTKTLRQHVVLRGLSYHGEGGTTWAVADPIPSCNVRELLQRMSWLLGQREPPGLELVVFVVAGNYPYELEAGTTGIRTRVQVVRAREVQSVWSKKTPIEPGREYGAWIRIRSPREASSDGT
jgi:hypothetical protein